MVKMNFLNFYQTTKSQRKNTRYAKKNPFLSEFIRKISSGKNLFSMSYKSATKSRFGPLSKYQFQVNRRIAIGLRCR